MRKAIALIELIFAIIVIAITLLAVPNLLALSNKTTKDVITQESISSAASQLSMIMSLYWDEKDSISEYESPILYVNSGDIELNETLDSNNNPLGRRIGSNIETSRRYALESNKTKFSASITLGKENNESIENDIDDFNGHTYTLVSYEEAKVDVGEYKDTNITITTNVNYISDANSYNNTNISFDNPFDTNVTNSTNIKSIIITVQSTFDPSKKIVLKAFSCNIGATKLKERVFQ